MSTLVSRAKATVNAITLRILKWRMTSVMRLRKVGTRASYYAVTILGVILAAGLHHPVAQRAISEFKSLDTIFIATGGMIGTVLALVFSLSVIPIQRAVETFTPSITRLYRDDHITQFIFITLAGFCLLSFVMAVDGIVCLQGSTLLPVEMVIIAITLDMLRWHHRRVSQLLEPNEAIRRLSLKITGYIDQTQRTISRLARVQQRTLSAEEKSDQSQEQLESAFYSALTNHPAPINAWTGELAEIAHKAVVKRETYTAELAISAMTKVAQHYLNCRKDNLTVFPSPETLFLASESDVRAVLIPIYDHFNDINRNAVALKAETTCIHVARALGAIASHTASLKARAFRSNSAPITHMPMYYLQECVEVTQRNNLDDVALQSSDVLLSVAKGAPDNVYSTDVHLPAVEGQYKITLAFLTAGKGALANEVLKDTMTLAHHLLERKHFQFVEILRDILKKLEALAPLAVAHEKAFGSPAVGLPLAVSYDLSNPMSIGYLATQAVSLIEREEGREWVNPYGRFMQVNEAIYRHFRNLAENVDLGSSFLLWHIIQTIKHIACVYLKVLERSITDDISHNKALVQQVPRYLAFFWVVFSKATTISHHSAEEACGVLAWIGMSFYAAGHAEVAKISADNIASITDSCCKITKNPSPYNIADLLILIWHIRLVAEARNDKDLVNAFDEKIAKPKVLSDALWPEVLKALENAQRTIK